MKRTYSNYKKTSGPGPAYQVGKVVSVPRAVPQRAITTYFPARRGVRSNMRQPQELKFFDTAISFAVDATGEVPATGQLVLIPQGDTESSRDGRMAYVKSLQLRLSVIQQPGASANSATNVILYLVQDMQANGAAAAVTDVLTGTNLATALRNIPNSARFRVLKRFKINLTSQAGVTTAYNQVSKCIDYYTNLDVPLSFSGATGAISELKTNNLFLLAGTDGLTDDTVAVGGNCRVRFYD